MHCTPSPAHQLQPLTHQTIGGGAAADKDGRRVCSVLVDDEKEEGEPLEGGVTGQPLNELGTGETLGVDQP